MYRTSENGEDLNYRIIDSNNLIDEKIRLYMEEEAARRNVKPKHSGGGEFVEGLTGEQIELDGEEGMTEDGQDPSDVDALFAEEEEIQEDPAIIQNAQEEAQRIVEGAQNHAEMIISDAKAEVEQLFKNTEKAAQEQGLKEGREEAQSELESLKEDLENDRLAMQQQFEIERAQMESELVDVILDVFESVFTIEFADKKDLLLHMISNTLKGIDGAKKFTIKVPPERMREMEENKNYILEQVGMGIDMTIMADSSLHDNDCVIETENGIFECGPLLQLENLIKDMKALSFTR